MKIGQDIRTGELVPYKKAMKNPDRYEIKNVKVPKGRFKKMVAKKRGWTDWVFPKVGNLFLFKCCDCGLIHEMEFKTFVEGRQYKSGNFQVVELPKHIRAMFRARRMKIPREIKNLILKLK